MQCKQQHRKINKSESETSTMRRIRVSFIPSHWPWRASKDKKDGVIINCDSCRDVASVGGLARSGNYVCAWRVMRGVLCMVCVCACVCVRVSVCLSLCLQCAGGRHARCSV